MSSTAQKTLPNHLIVVHTLAHLLARLEASRVPVSAAQYRTVAARLSAELGRVESDDGLDEVLAAFPAAAEIYENVHYAQAGLCRASLDVSLSAELHARELIDRVMASSSKPRDA